MSSSRNSDERALSLGRDDGIGVENLRGSGMIAGEMSAAYDDIVTMSLVSRSGFNYRQKWSLTAEKAVAGLVLLQRIAVLDVKVCRCWYFSWLASELCLNKELPFFESRRSVSL